MIEVLKYKRCSPHQLLFFSILGHSCPLNLTLVQLGDLQLRHILSISASKHSSPGPCVHEVSHTPPAYLLPPVETAVQYPSVCVYHHRGQNMAAKYRFSQLPGGLESVPALQTCQQRRRVYQTRASRQHEVFLRTPQSSTAGRLPCLLASTAEHSSRAFHVILVGGEKMIT